MMLFARRFSSKALKSVYRPNLKELAKKISENQISTKYDEALRKFEGKIFFNSVLEIQAVRLRKHDEIVGRSEKKAKAEFQRQSKALPVVLSQFCEEASNLKQCEDEPQEIEEEYEKVQNLPYSRFLRVEKEDNLPMLPEERVPKNWLQDYELYDESENETESTYGTPDPNIPVSSVPCSGCGAHLHCKDSSIPGYVPSELFARLDKDQLSTINCQRCHFLINYNTAINVTVKPEDYIDIVSTIKDKFALAIILVDLLDFPCSIFTGLKEILGKNRPVFIVGNKVCTNPLFSNKLTYESSF